VIAYQVVEEATGSGGVDITLIVVTSITAVFAYLGVRAGRAAKTAAAETQLSNSSDHGKVAARLDRLTEVSEQLAALVAEIKDDLSHIDGRMHDLGKRQLTITDQLVVHQQWHLDHPNREPPT